MLFEKLLEDVESISSQYECENEKKHLKELSQFFTPLKCAKQMSKIAIENLPVNNSSLHILDPCAGFGILTLSLLEQIIENTNFNDLHCVLYEKDSTLIPYLNNALTQASNLAKKQNVKISYEVINADFLKSNEDNWKTNKFNTLFDLIIMNPPYKKIKKDDALCWLEIVNGQPNLYQIFFALCIKLLNISGTLVTLSPRSFCSGKYFSALRKYMLSEGMFNRIHYFHNRTSIFNNEVCQETIITSFCKSKLSNTVVITSSYSIHDFENQTYLALPFENLLWSDEKIILLPLSTEDYSLVETISSFPTTFQDINLSFATGKVVDFRNQEYLFSEYKPSTVPMFFLKSLTPFFVTWPTENKKNYFLITENNKQRLIPNKTQLFLRRISSKDNIRKLSASIYLAINHGTFEYIAVDNKINYLKYDSLPEEIVYGVYILLNSSLYEKFYRILNGNTQVNVSELNALPSLPLNSLIELGELYKNENLTTAICDAILERYIE